MGWAGGSMVMIGVINSIKDRVKDKEIRKYIYTDVVNCLEDADWDCVEEALGYDEAFDEKFREWYPDYFEEGE